MPFSNQIANLSISPYIVTGSLPGPYHTIQQAINQALADGVTTTIVVRPGTYTENLTLYTGIHIQGTDQSEVEIIGTHTPPATGSITISKCKLSNPNGNVLESMAVGTTTILIDGCLLNLGDGYLFQLVNWTGDLYITNCTDISAYNMLIINGGGSALTIEYSDVGTAAFPAYTTGIVSIYSSRISCWLEFAGNSTVDIENSIINGYIALDNPAAMQIYNSRIITIAPNPCLELVSTGLTTLENVVLDTDNAIAIDGTGQIELGEVVFNNSSGIAGTITYAGASLVGVSNLNVEGELLLAGAPGSATDVLTSNGTGFAPTWQPAGGGGGFVWAAAPADASLVNGHGAIDTKAALLTMILPATAAVGTIVAIQGSAVGVAGWKIAQNAGQNIWLQGKSTTIGVTGYLASTLASDGVTLLCTVADTTWNSIAVGGNITVF